ncbi:MAG TPA: acyltransferase [Acetobacteraceae bacterium]|nr:acyltransferase [Acetobacteraceae bacterium]
MRPAKVEYLEGLRGVAAMQVLLLHFFTGFLPETAGRVWPPFNLAFDGHTAVYVFFLISGTVLTPSFARPGSFAAKMARRVVRLGIPVAAAAAIAAVLIGWLPEAHRQAAAITGSAWLAMDSSGAPTLAHLAREIGVDSLLLGYREATLFGPVAAQLPPMERSLDAPFWSLHLELYGSLLVLCLVTLRERSARAHRIAVAASAVVFGTHPMFLFVLGHLAFPLLRRPSIWLGALLLLSGVALCATKDWSAVEWLRVTLAHTELAAAPNLYQFQSQLGAVALYFGILLCPPMQRPLASVIGRVLGRLSFSIYLLHFPILFTLVAFAALYLPIGAAFVLFLLLTLLAAIAFERWVDRPAIALSRVLSARPLSAGSR